MTGLCLYGLNRSCFGVLLYDSVYCDRVADKVEVRCFDTSKAPALGVAITESGSRNELLSEITICMVPDR